MLLSETVTIMNHIRILGASKQVGPESPRLQGRGPSNGVGQDAWDIKDNPQRNTEWNSRQSKI